MTNVIKFRSLPGRRPLVALAVVGLAAPVLATARPAGAAGSLSERYPVPPGKVYTLHGRGFGHGHGMSQWGAYGAAKVAQLSSNQILAFYFPHTTLKTVSTTKTVRVLLTAVAAPVTGYVQVAPAAGLAETPDGGDPTALPTTSPAATKGATTYPITAWRLQQTGTSVSLRAAWNKRWHTVTKNVGTSVAFSDTAAVLAVTEPSGAKTTKTIRYRGVISAQLHSGNLEAVDTVPVESYIDAVVPSEMPSTWTAAALQAQAVAARTYTWRLIDSPKTSWFDLYGDTRDQAYGGIGSATAATTNAVHATAGEVVVDSTGQPILAQYSSSDGGWTASGGEPYLPAKSDPYDGKVPNDAHAWTTTLSAAAITAAYPSIGTLRRLAITGRDGHGVWGGRITTMSIVGTRGTVKTTGPAFQAAFGLRSYWFRPTPTPGPPRRVTAKGGRGTLTVKWAAPAPVSGSAPVSGYHVVLHPGGRTVNVAASVLTATFTKLAKGTYTLSVFARSNAGPSLAGTLAAPVVVKAGN